MNRPRLKIVLCCILDIGCVGQYYKNTREWLNGSEKSENSGQDESVRSFRRRSAGSLGNRLSLAHTQLGADKRKTVTQPGCFGPYEFQAEPDVGISKDLCHFA